MILLPTFHAGYKLHPLPVLVGREDFEELVQFLVGVEHIRGNTPVVTVKGKGLRGYPADGIWSELGVETTLWASCEEWEDNQCVRESHTYYAYGVEYGL